MSSEVSGHQAAPPELQGQLSAHPNGFAFVRATDGGPDVFVAKRDRAGALHGQQVAVVVGKDDGHRRQGKVTAILSAPPSWMGEATVQTEAGWSIQPLDPRYPECLVAPSDLAVGRLVQVQSEPAQTGTGPVTARVLRQFGTLPNLDLINDLVSTLHELVPSYTPAEISQWSPPAIATATDNQAREDLRHLPFVTIDGASTRDLDDALWAQKLPGDEIELFVAVADVSHFVQPGSSLDAAARRRTTSVYLPGRVLPMLPPSLSENACSLNPGVDRLAVVCRMRIDADGHVAGQGFVRAHIRSAHKLTYDAVERSLFGTGSCPSGWEDCWSSLLALRQAYERLLADRARRGAMDFDAPEFAFTPEASSGFHARRRGHAHRLVEETMVAANVQSAKTLDALALDSLYRAHGGPPPHKQETLANLLRAHQVDLPEASSHALSGLARSHPHLSSAILLAQDRASYQLRNTGHFGLGLSHYAHVTSPIRRYPDLVVHRMLLGQSQPDLEALALECSEGERRAAICEREAVDRYRALRLSDQVGERFIGRIDAVSPMGLFITLSATGGSGLLPLAELGEAVADVPAQQVMDADGRLWCLGAEVEVLLASADWKLNRIEFAAPVLRQAVED